MQRQHFDQERHSFNHVTKFVFGIEKSSFERSANFHTLYLLNYFISKIYCQPLLPGSAELQPGLVQLGRHDERTDPPKPAQSTPTPIGGGCCHPQKPPATETLLSLAKILKLEIKHLRTDIEEGLGKVSKNI